MIKLVVNITKFLQGKKIFFKIKILIHLIDPNVSWHI